MYMYIHVASNVGLTVCVDCMHVQCYRTPAAWSLISTVQSCRWASPATATANLMSRTGLAMLTSPPGTRHHQLQCQRQVRPRQRKRCAVHPRRRRSLTVLSLHLSSSASDALMSAVCWSTTQHAPTSARTRNTSSVRAVATSVLHGRSFDVI